MTEIILIRHGQSANNALPDHSRVPDPGLTELGVKQANATAQWLEEVPVSRLYCSPFLRALETTRPIAQSKSLSVEVRPDLFEVGGCYSGHDAVGKVGAAGMGLGQLRSLYPQWNIDPTIGDNGWWGRDFELDIAAQSRAERVSQWIAEELVPQGGVHVLVIHADFKRLLIAAILRKSGADITGALGELHNVGVTRFAWHQNRWLALTINATNHLPYQWVT